jgi:NAD(P)-dependent dehydrogenase (short-subunit alcohol dehydrogenase family)
MENHQALQSGNVAVITGAGDGIGLATARYCHSLGMSVCLADRNDGALAQAAEELGDVMTVVTDVSDLEQVLQLKDAAYQRYGRVDLLMNNAGIARPTSSWNQYDGWRAVLETNLWGVINGIHAFAAAMIEQGTPAAIVNTGSKQGITTPPGNPAYNVSKAGVKAATEALAHDLRSEENCKVSAHLLLPGFTYTGMIRAFLAEKPEGAWTPEQVVDYMVAAMARQDFYILCPDNDTPREIDNRRMAWAMADLIENRPALSRWHPDYTDSFEDYVNRPAE